MTVNMYIATVAWLCLVLGVLNRKKRKKHVPLMLTGITLDFLLVLYLQVVRDAIQKAAEFSLSALQQTHIGFSTLALLLYFPVLYLGSQLVKGKGTPRTKSLHVRIALSAFLFRTLGFVFMFSMIK